MLILGPPQFKKLYEINARTLLLRVFTQPSPHEFPHRRGSDDGEFSMGMTLDRGRYYFVMNVPNHLFGCVFGKAGQPVRQVRQALWTADLSVAKRKAFELEELKRSEWHMLELGEDALAHEKFASAKLTAESRGFDYVPSTVLLQKSFQENLPRLMAAAGTASQPTAPNVADATLGVAEVALPPLRSVFNEYVALTKTKKYAQI